ncbi:MAG: ribosome-associated heat shock protein Hsp15 [Aestuariibacter sp.]
MEKNESIRLDKWLWAARFFKTRSLARDNINAGKVHYNGQRCKPGKNIELGAIIRIPQGFDHKEVEIKKLEERRQGAAIAQTLYEELQESIERREKNAQARRLSAFHSPKPDQRPDKKQRRELIKFKHS